MAKLFKLNYFLESVLVSIILGWIIPLTYILRMLINHDAILIQNVIAGVVFSFFVSFCIYFVNVQIVKRIQKNEKKFHSQFGRLFAEFLITIVI